jgi:hypothetical protein
LSPEAHLKGLVRACCFPVLALAQRVGLPAPGLSQDEGYTHAEAIALLSDVFGRFFPGLRP